MCLLIERRCSVPGCTNSTAASYLRTCLNYDAKLNICLGGGTSQIEREAAIEYDGKCDDHDAGAPSDYGSDPSSSPSSSTCSSSAISLASFGSPGEYEDVGLNDEVDNIIRGEEYTEEEGDGEEEDCWRGLDDRSQDHDHDFKDGNLFNDNKRLCDEGEEEERLRDEARPHKIRILTVHRPRRLITTSRPSSVDSDKKDMKKEMEIEENWCRR